MGSAYWLTNVANKARMAAVLRMILSDLNQEG